MKVLIISDGHGAIDNLRLLKSEAEQCDFVIFGGDFAAFNKPETGLPFLKELVKLHDTVFAVLGNCDEPDFIEHLDAAGISIEKSLSQYEGLMLTGSGGGSKFTGTTPYERTDEELVSDLHLVEENFSEDESPINNLIVVAHNPPHKTKLDKVAPLVHVGSPLIRSFIEKHQPLLVVSGHIHESFATDTLGNSVLVNPGALVEGRYARAEINGNKKQGFSVSVELKQL
ncbi:metallophosphoesterase [Treponema phagedenis]|uniref:metallophosphoesterase n=1 Tax=Treponema phagedenis TaxID=162 RepID=UPI0001F63EE9|nr:metallophosphoesterase [Treponema phagedenis]EFW37616.1 Ser/Thr phosphatase family protein [Treponema phagedenis F0421]TYT76443.1 serine/threonine protein phosphatase [Treponema phagedenis]TYT76861.1 serine/threonine protein phosphatase [Treponema phagedenis]TYT79850.1 serine/threonine protein phosphatase [Treponema phagedenis]